MYDRKWLELQIVRLGEKYPDRVGLYGEMRTHDCSDHCISGQIVHDTIGCNGRYGDFQFWTELDDNNCWQLLVDMVNMNNAGVKWGEIPIRLGLVPGEQPAVPVHVDVAEAMEAVHA